MTVLSVDGLTKRFGGLVAVDDLDFEVGDDEILGLIGPNGSGKTTVFNCIMSIYDVTGGSITFEGTDVTDARTHEIVNLGLSRVSQESNPIGSMTVRENIELFTFENSVFSFYGGASDEQVRAYAERLDLGDRLDEAPGSLPHADVRRLEIAKALATEPEMLLLDEPFAGMNQQEIRDLSAKIEEFRQAGMPMVVVDHNMRGLMELVDRVVVLQSGSKIAEGPPEEVAEVQRVQEAYLGSQGGAL